MAAESSSEAASSDEYIDMNYVNENYTQESGDDFDKWKIALIIEMVLFVIMIFFTIQLFQIDEATAKKEVKHSQEVYSVKNLSLKAKMIFNSTTDVEIKKYVKSVCNELNSCPTSSNFQVMAIDDSIGFSLDALSQSVMSGDINSVKASASSVIALIRKRKLLSK